MAKILLAPSTENKPVKKQVSFPQSLGPMLHLFVQWLVSNLLIRYNYCASVCFSCVKPVRVSFELTSPLQKRDRCLQTLCIRLCKCGTKSPPKCWTLPGKLLVACKKLRGNMWESPAGVTPPLFNNSRDSSLSSMPQLPHKLHWENSLTIKTVEKNMKGEPYAQGLNTSNLLHPIYHLPLRATPASL